MTLLRPFPDLWLSVVVKVIPSMYRAFSLDTNPAISSLGTRTWARTNEWDMTVGHAFSCLCDQLKHSVDESGSLDDAKQVVSALNCSQDDVAGSRKPFQAHICIPLAGPPYWTRYGLFEPTVMLFGTTNARAEFQGYINNAIWEALDHFV